MRRLRQKEFWQLVKQELTRKSIHMASIFTIFIARYSQPLVILLLAAGTLVFIFAESIRLIRGGKSLITQIVALTKRKNEEDRPALGPITLAIGLMFAYLLFPPAAARVAVAALALGDGMASLVGRLFGRFRPAILFGKSVEGSLSCFIVVLGSTYVLTKGNLVVSFTVALVVTIIEALPIGSFDNVLIPLVAGVISYRFGF